MMMMMIMMLMTTSFNIRRVCVLFDRVASLETNWIIIPEQDALRSALHSPQELPEAKFLPFLEPSCLFILRLSALSRGTSLKTTHWLRGSMEAPEPFHRCREPCSGTQTADGQSLTSSSGIQ
jgi:hypothetical protein